MNDDRFDRWTAALLLAASLVLRVWDIAGIEHYVGDQNTVVLAAYRFPETGMFSPDSWEQPPLHYYLIRLGTLLFGDNAYGWRMKNVLLGSLTVPLLFLLGRALFPGRRTALLAALFLLFDPLHLYYSRTIYAEISSLPFFLGAALVTVRYQRGRTASPLWAGVMLGFAIAQKWYYLLPLLVLAATALCRPPGVRRPSAAPGAAPGRGLRRPSADGVPAGIHALVRARLLAPRVLLDAGGCLPLPAEHGIL